jgi:putative Mg2+ transporter-C (MgtC) family protein
MFWDGKKNRGNRKEREVGDPRALPAASSRWYNPHMHFAIDWPQGLEDVIKLFIAYFLALPVGWYREREAHSVGVRTFPVVAMASCGYVLLGSQSAHMSIEAQSRIIQGVVAGIGFIGGGAILKSESGVHGVAAAASIWNIGVVGASVAQNRYLLAATLAALNLFALRVLLPLKARLDGESAAKPGAAPK